MDSNNQTKALEKDSTIAYGTGALTGSIAGSLEGIVGLAHLASWERTIGKVCKQYLETRPPSSFQRGFTAGRIIANPIVVTAHGIGVAVLSVAGHQPTITYALSLLAINAVDLSIRYRNDYAKTPESS